MATKKAPELFYDESRFCGGCGHGIFNRILAEVLEEMDIVSDTIPVLDERGCHRSATRKDGCGTHRNEESSSG